MTQPEDVEYAVVLVSPIFGETRQNAETILEEAVEYLNTHKETPGFRFAPHVSARLEIVPDVEQAEAKLNTDDSVALVIMHELPDDERLAFTWDCVHRGVAVCHTLPPVEQPDFQEPPSRPQKKGWEIRFRKRSEDDDSPPVHSLCETVLDAPLEGDPEMLGDRVSQVIAVMALGVMGFDWKRRHV